MSSADGDVVTAFLAAMEVADEEGALALVHDDLVFHNVPLAGPKPGGPAVRYHCRLFRRYAVHVRWELVNQVAERGRVIHERVDHTRFLDETTTVLPVVGVFEVRGGRIGLWRDYWDTTTLTTQLGTDWISFEQRLRAVPS
ncbi:MAG: hypothetical protein ABS81_05340 [Pseudonocardia sp. SCN 72-86]|nr:MAG: hypothetical protein ABS81_05340 [Pseudonocardia sp. SCN 72-86]